MKLELNIRNTENIDNLSQTDLRKIERIFEALVSTGSLTGVRGGQTIIHFDQQGNFKGVQTSYWNYVDRTN